MSRSNKRNLWRNFTRNKEPPIQGKLRTPWPSWHLSLTSLGCSDRIGNKLSIFQTTSESWLWEFWMRILRLNWRLTRSYKTVLRQKKRSIEKSSKSPLLSTKSTRLRNNSPRKWTQWCSSTTVPRRNRKSKSKRHPSSRSQSRRLLLSVKSRSKSRSELSQPTSQFWKSDIRRQS